MKVSPKFKWMIPYIEAGMSLVSSEHTLARVGAWTSGKSRGADEFAALFQDRQGDPHRIWMHTHYYHGQEVRPFSKIDLLELLAHEIAHMEDWNHTPKHKKLESQITSVFMEMLSKEGYVSEEVEFQK